MAQFREILVLLQQSNDNNHFALIVITLLGYLPKSADFYPQNPSKIIDKMKEYNT